MPLHIGLIGDHDPAVTAHRAIPHALRLAARRHAVEISHVWVPTEEVRSTDRLRAFDGIWCTPASPYRSMKGALLAIRHAREAGVPFLGSCGGFQHAIVEYARNVLGWENADHAETAPDAERAVIAPLSCALVEVEADIHLLPGSRIAQAYGSAQAREGYRCRYGLAPAFREALLAGPLRATAFDTENDVRAVELAAHPFFVATLFQPERAALADRTPPLAAAFVAASVARQRTN